MGVTVVIPVYNRTWLLKTAIESVLCQKYPLLQIIVVDDGSESSTFDALRPYMSLITYIRIDKNSGVSHARNVGIHNAKYEYIAFLDSDDIWLPNKLMLQISYMKENNLMISHTDEYWYKNNRFVNQKRKHKKYGGYILKDILDICRISPSSAVVHNSVFDKIGLFDENQSVCEDYDMWLRIANKYYVGYLEVKTIIKVAHDEPQLSLNTLHLEYYRLLSLTKFICRNKISYYNKICAIDELKRKFRIVEKGLNKKD